jgi:hypothetical protein
MAGTVACDQAVPFQWSISACEPRPVLAAPPELPTAQALVSDGALTPRRLAFCPVRRGRDYGPAGGQSRAGAEQQRRGHADPGADLGS